MTTQTAIKTQPLVKGLLRPVLVSAGFFLLLTGLGYPLATTLVANVMFPYQAQGSLIERDGLVIGSAVIGQHFSRPKYFQGRPSMTADKPYNAGSSGASNLGPTSQKLIDQVAQRAQDYRQLNGLAPDALVPVDAVTASASGLDPHISVANAQLQVARVARLRKVPEAELMKQVQAHTEQRTLGLLGEPRVNVLQLNLALDAQAPVHQQPLAASE